MDTTVPDHAARLTAALEGRYRVERLLGEGGMAMVYLAEDLRHGRQVAVKVLKEELSATLGTERFLAEIRTTAKLQHPHILPLFDSGQADDLLYYVMPYVEGESLRDLLSREGRLPVDEALRTAGVLAEALQYAHENGVVHRDVKPANVMLSRGLPMMTDFGIALAVRKAGDPRDQPPASMGTPLYTSPEQATGETEVDARSDVYSLACVLFELLTGDPPLTARSSEATLARRLTEAPPKASSARSAVPSHVDAALIRALQADPEHRFPTAADFGHALGRPGAPASRLDASSAPTPVPRSAHEVVGRGKERAELQACLEAAAAGSGSLVFLGGEPGVGKTRLAEFVLQEARGLGCMCVVGRCYESAGMPPYTPFLEQLEYTSQAVPPERFRAVLGSAAPEIARMMPALRVQFPDIGPGIELPPDQMRHHLFHRYRDFMARAAELSPLVVLFDDLHWADESSLMLLEFLVQHVHAMPVLALATYRDLESDMSPAFAEFLVRLTKRPNVHRIALKPFDRDEVAELVASLGGSQPPDGLVDAVFEGTEGNAFFVQEVFRHLAEEGNLFDDEGRWRSELDRDGLDVPEGVRLVVGRRLERVTEACRKILTTASVMGHRFDLSVLEAAGSVDADTFLDALEEAQAAHIVQPFGGPRDPTYSFTHGLIRQTLVESLSLPRLQRSHLRIADAMEATYGSRVESRAVDMAHHLFQAGAVADPARTVRFLKLAGDQALVGSGCQEALAQYERALSMDQDVPEALVPALQEGKTYALDGMGRWLDALATGQECATRFATLGDAEGMARVARLVVYRLIWLAQYVPAAEMARKTLELLDESPGKHRAQLRFQAGLAMGLLNQPGSWDLIEAGLAEAEASGDEATILQGKLAVSIWHHHRGAFAESVRVCQDAWELLENAADQTTLADFLWVQALCLPPLGRLEEARDVIRQAREVGQERNELGPLLCAAFGEITVVGMTTGDGTRLEEMGRALAGGFAAAGGWAKTGLIHAGLGLLWQGDARGAAELMDVLADASDEPRLWGALSAAWRFRTAAYAGMPEAADLFETARPMLFRAGERPYPGDGFGLHAAIEGLAVLGRFDAAAALYPDAVASLELGLLGNHDGLWACTTGLAAACGTRWEEAFRHFATAVEQGEAIPHVMARHHAHFWWGWALRRRGGRGDADEARRHLEAALVGYRSVGADLFARRATDLLTGRA